MAKLIFSDDFLSIVLDNDVVNCSLDSSAESSEILRLYQVEAPMEKTIENESFIQCCSRSPCGQYFGLCKNKQLVIYKTDDWEVVCLGKADRNPSSLQFFPKSNYIVLADKSGSAAFYKYGKDSLEKVSELILAHNSLLTGALVSDDEKYVITCDRDEKIRVSNFPNVYNIQSFCLGHEQFITDITFLPHDKNILVSTSGDATVRFWEYHVGKEVAVFPKSSKVAPEGESIPFVKIASCKKDSEVSLLAILKYMNPEIVVVQVKGCLQTNIEVELVETIQLSTIPLDISFWGTNLFSITQDHENPLKLCHGKIQDNELITKLAMISKYLVKETPLLKSNLKIRSLDMIPILFKREYDNVQEYQTKKKARLNNKS